MKFSLITATLGRTAELKRLCESLVLQSHRDFELIVVDQNSDDRLVAILQEYASRFPVLHLRSAKGLSRSRNVGLKRASGDVVAFPDDDCSYLPDLLENIGGILETRRDLAGITCSQIDETGAHNSRWDTRAGVLTRYNLFRRSFSNTIFLRSAAVRLTGGFDETIGLGAGTPWMWGEEHEYMIRVLANGLVVSYYPNLYVIHPNKPLHSDAAGKTRKYDESMGLMRMLRTYNYPLWFAAYMVVRSLGGALLSLLRGDFARMQSYYAGLRGKVRGWREAAPRRVSART